MGECRVLQGDWTQQAFKQILNPSAEGGHRPPMVNHLGVLARQCTVALSAIIHGPQGIDDCIGVMATTCKIPY